MAEIGVPTTTYSGSGPSLASLDLPPANKISGLIAGDSTIFQGAACYVGSDGLVHLASGAAANAAARVRGFALTKGGSGQSDAITLASGCVLGYPTGQPAGTDLYLSGVNAGALATTASTGGTSPIGFVIDTQRIYVFAIR